MRSGKQWLVCIYWVLIFSFIISGCKQAQKIATPKKIKKYSVGKVIKLTNDNSLKFETLSVKKVSLSLTNEGKTSSVTASYKIRRDSIVQVYAQKLIPIAKMEVNLDSFRIAVFPEHELLFGDNNYLSKFIGIDVDYKVLQALLSNKMFSFRQDPKDKNFKEFFCDIDEDMYKISSLRNRKLKRFNKNEGKYGRNRNRQEEGHVIKQDIYIDPDSFVVRKMVFNDLETLKGVKLEFSNYEKVMDQWFPGLINIQVLGDKKIELVIKLSKVSLNDETNFGFSYDPKYKRKLIE